MMTEPIQSEAKFAMKDSGLAGILWHQGEKFRIERGQHDKEI